MSKFIRSLYLLGSFISTLILGTYLDASIRHGESIEFYRYFVTLFTVVWFFRLYKEREVKV